MNLYTNLIGDISKINSSTALLLLILQGYDILRIFKIYYYYFRLTTMFKCALITILFFVLFSRIHAQKFYFTGIGLRGSAMMDKSTDRDRAAIINSAAKNNTTYKLQIDSIYNHLFTPTRLEKAHNGFIIADFFFRASKTNQFFKWSEWCIGIGYTPLARNIETFPMRKNITSYSDTIGYFMKRVIDRSSGWMIENKFIVNSSPYKSRVMKYFGLGFRMAAMNEKNNTAVLTELHVYKNNEYNTIANLSNTSNALLGFFAIAGLKYNMSCHFNLYADINLGYCWRFYPEKIQTHGYNTAISFGIKYKMGNGPNDENNQTNTVEDEKSKKRNKKKLQVYW